MSANNTTTPRRWTGPMVWDGRELGQSDSWIVRLGASDVTEIAAAVDASLAPGTALQDLTGADFKFGAFGERLLRLREVLLNERGFAVIRGLPVEWRDEQLIRAYWGIGTWLGDAVPQNAAAHLLGHIIDQRATQAPGTRIYQTNQAQPFHSDSCDIVGLLCLRKARCGGVSSVASSPAIHNEMLDHAPGALETLYGEFHCDRWDEIPQGKRPSYPVRVFNDIEGAFVCCAMDPDIRSAQRLDEVPPLTPGQIHALDTFQTSASRLALDMTLARGDIQLLNNHTVVHARGAFSDFDAPARRRYLIRLWLSSRLGRALPGFMAERWGNIEQGTVRGGIVVPDVLPVVPLSDP